MIRGGKHMTILLLTKSLSFEQEFVRKLNDFGHEVLCSKKFLIDLQKDAYLGMDLNYFDTLILSETISDQEVSQILPFFLNFKCTIYRKTITPLSLEETNKWKGLGIADSISQSTCLEELREKLVASHENKTTLKWTLPDNENLALERLLQNFSKQERVVFQALQSAQKKFINRETLSHQLWGEPPSKSKESRLSGIIRSIKRKLSEFGFDETCLETSWGRGYRIEDLQIKNREVVSAEEIKTIES